MRVLGLGTYYLSKYLIEQETYLSLLHRESYSTQDVFWDDKFHHSKVKRTNHKSRDLIRSRKRTSITNTNNKSH